jgi:hypothetical protein
LEAGLQGQNTVVSIKKIGAAVFSEASENPYEILKPTPKNIYRNDRQDRHKDGTDAQ